MKNLLLTASFASIMLLAFAGVSHAGVVAPVLSYDAAVDAAGDATWTNNGTVAGFDYDFYSGGVPGGVHSPIAVSDGVTTISSTYQGPGDAAGQPSGTGLSAAIGQGVDNTFELWFRPADLVGDHILFETGGGNRGMQIGIIDDQVHFLVQSNDGNRATTVATLAAGSVNRFNHLVGVADFTGADVAIDLYLNGALVDSASQTGVLFYDGGGRTGLGRLQDSIPGLELFSGLSDFDGQISIFNAYTAALTSSEISGLHAAKLVPEPVSAVLMTLGALALVGVRRRR